jgi:hypothetical protein
VLGYIDAHEFSEKSIFVFPRNLPFWFTSPTESDCPYPPPCTSSACITQLLNQGVLVPADNPDPSGSLTPIYQPKICVDCREQGGTNIKPDYWPN